VTFAVAARSIQSESTQTLSPLQRALLDEYAAWYAYGQDARPVLLRPLIEERGWEAAPQALWFAQDPTTLGQYLARWMSLPALAETEDADLAGAYFGVLLNLERQALIEGRTETFLLIQDSGWREEQEQYFWLNQVDAAMVPDRAVEVWATQVAGDHARVLLMEPLPSVDGLPPQSLGGNVYMRFEDGDWKHASPLAGYSWSFPPPQP
jgi:hypothetical protein